MVSSKIVLAPFASASRRPSIRRVNGSRRDPQFKVVSDLVREAEARGWPNGWHDPIIAGLLNLQTLAPSFAALREHPEAFRRCMMERHTPGRAIASAPTSRRHPVTSSNLWLLAPLIASAARTGWDDISRQALGLWFCHSPATESTRALSRALLSAPDPDVRLIAALHEVTSLTGYRALEGPDATAAIALVLKQLPEQAPIETFADLIRLFERAHAREDDSRVSSVLADLIDAAKSRVKPDRASPSRYELETMVTTRYIRQLRTAGGRLITFTGERHDEPVVVVRTLSNRLGRFFRFRDKPGVATLTIKLVPRAGESFVQLPPLHRSGAVFRIRALEERHSRPDYYFAADGSGRVRTRLRHFYNLELEPASGESPGLILPALA